MGMSAPSFVAYLGRMSRVTVPVSPPESRTVRYSRYQTFVAVSPLVGIVNDPPVTPLSGATNGWVCASWWKSTCQV